MKIALSKVEFVTPVHIFGGMISSLGAKPVVPSGPTRDIVLDTDTGLVIIDGVKGIPSSNVKCFDIAKVEPAPAAPTKK